MPTNKRWPTLSVRVLVAASALVFSLTPLRAGDPKTKPVRGAKSQTLVWDLSAAGHLMRRAGFSASPEELDFIVQQGFQTTLDNLLHPETVGDSHIEEIEGRSSSPDGNPYVAGSPSDRTANMLGYRDLFLYRMAFTHRQLFEKMTLFWHDHFATSGETVLQTTNDTMTPLIGNQHALERQYAMGNFKEFVHAMSHDAAILEWLDQPFNVKEHPNENWARELMELFTIGIGNYTELDVRESARAFTGWTFSFDDGKFVFRAGDHDFGQKTFMGVSGDLDGDDIIEIIFQQPATARFIARKLWEFFVYPDPSEKLVDELGDSLRDSGYEIRPLLKAIFEHPEFFSERARRALVKSPAELAADFIRETSVAPGRGIVNIGYLSFMDDANQSLFDPPDVAGWPSGVLWLNAATMLTRFNLFGSKVAFRQTTYVGEEVDHPVQGLPYWLIDAISKHRLRSSDDFITHFLDRFLQGEASADVRLALEDYMEAGPEGVPQPFDYRNPDADVKVRGLLFLILTMPEYQMN